jgi:hypothetical protein
LIVLKRFLSTVFLALTCIIATAWATVYLFYPQRTSYQITNAAITSIIRETPLRLVTNTIVTMVICTFEDLPELNTDKYLSTKFRDFILGKTEALFIAKVYYDFGIDLLEINEENISIEENFITISLPEPKLLRNSVDLESIRDYTKTTLLRSIWDTAVGREMMSELKKAFQLKAMEFAKESGLEPTKASIIKNIELFVSRIVATQTDRKVIFK